jgi:hypothetical protein
MRLLVAASIVGLGLAAAGSAASREAVPAAPAVGCKYVFKIVHGRSHKKKVCHRGLPRARFAISLDRVNGPVSVGNLVAYRIGVRNLGPDIAPRTELDVSFDSPTPFAHAFISEGGPGFCEQVSPASTSQEVTCRLGNMVPSPTVTVINLFARADRSGRFSVTTAIDAPIKNRTGAARATDATEVLASRASADVSVSSDVSREPLSGNFIETIRLTNNGPTEASRVFLTVLLPQGTELLDRTVSPGWKGINACLPLTSFGAGYFQNCWDGIPSGQTITAAVTLRALDDAPSQLETNALVSAWTPDADLANNRTTVTVKR